MTVGLACVPSLLSIANVGSQTVYKPKQPISCPAYRLMPNAFLTPPVPIGPLRIPSTGPWTSHLLRMLLLSASIMRRRTLLCCVMSPSICSNAIPTRLALSASAFELHLTIPSCMNYFPNFDAIALLACEDYLDERERVWYIPKPFGGVV
jgi:hypothetical protein